MQGDMEVFLPISRAPTRSFAAQTTAVDAETQYLSSKPMPENEEQQTPQADAPDEATEAVANDEAADEAATEATADATDEEAEETEAAQEAEDETDATAAADEEDAEAAEDVAEEDDTDETVVDEEEEPEDVAENGEATEHQTSIEELLKAGAHFGHLTSRWHPRMADYIFMDRNNIHIIDLMQTQVLLDRAAAAARRFAQRGKTILFAGTKKQAQEIVREYAEESGMPFMVNR